MTATVDFFADLATDPDRLTQFVMGLDPKPKPDEPAEPDSDLYFVASVAGSDPKPTEPQPDTYFVTTIAGPDPKPTEPQPDTYFVTSITA